MRSRRSIRNFADGQRQSAIRRTPKVPAGGAEVEGARLDEETTNDLASLNWYVVKRGDTLALIARKLSVSRSDLAEANYIKSTARVSPGDKLMVPRETTALMAARTDRPVPASDSRSLVADKVVPAVAYSGSDGAKVIYQVKSGDTLTSIARVFSTSVDAIKNWNHLPTRRSAPASASPIYAGRANSANISSLLRHPSSKNLAPPAVRPSLTH